MFFLCVSTTSKSYITMSRIFSVSISRAVKHSASWSLSVHMSSKCTADSWMLSLCLELQIALSKLACSLSVSAFKIRKHKALCFFQSKDLKTFAHLNKFSLCLGPQIAHYQFPCVLCSKASKYEHRPDVFSVSTPKPRADGSIIVSFVG
jgi:hypothetical protein